MFSKEKHFKKPKRNKPIYISLELLVKITGYHWILGCRRRFDPIHPMRLQASYSSHRDEFGFKQKLISRQKGDSRSEVSYMFIEQNTPKAKTFLYLTFLCLTITASPSTGWEVSSFVRYWSYISMQYCPQCLKITACYEEEGNYSHS